MCVRVRSVLSCCGFMRTLFSESVLSSDFSCVVHMSHHHLQPENLLQQVTPVACITHLLFVAIAFVHVMELLPCAMGRVKGMLVLLRQREKGKENVIFGVAKGLRGIVLADSVQRCNKIVVWETGIF